MNTIRVRIAVAINADGEWNACGWDEAEDKHISDYAVGSLSAEVVHFVEADIPIPEHVEPEVIDGEVTP